MNKILNGAVVSMTLAASLAVGGCGLFNDNQPTSGATTGGATTGGVTAVAVLVAAGSTAATPSAAPGTWVIPSTAE